MAQVVLVLGQSGTGKSASLRNFTKDEVLVINSADKPLPFKNKFECVTPSYHNMFRDIVNAMHTTKKKVIVVDDAQYIMSFQYMRRIQEKGWEKWNDIQGDFFNIIKEAQSLPADTIVYFLSHIERNDDGYEKIKTMGKMLDEKITIEGLFTTVLKTLVKDGTFAFVTQNSGMDTVKSPIGMFDSYAIDNDLKYVDTKIRNYYELGEYVSDEEVAKLDEEVAKPTVEKPTTERRTRRTRTASEPAKVEVPKVEAEQPATAPVTTEAQATTDVAPTTEAPKVERKVRRRKVRDEQPATAPVLALDDPTVPF